MQLKPVTIDILKYMSTINSSIVIKPGSKISTIAPGNVSIANFDSDDNFTEQISVFNLTEFLGVLNAFGADASIDVKSDRMVVSKGRAKVVYVYADPSILQQVPATPPKYSALVDFEISAELQQQITKMGALLGADDLTFTADGSTLKAKIHDERNPSANSFEVDISDDCQHTFVANIKLSKMKLYPGSYKVELSDKKLVRFTHNEIKLVVYVVMESTSKF